MSSDRVAELERKVEALTRHVLDLEAVQEIRKTQHKYGYYIDKCLYLPSCPPVPLLPQSALPSLPQSLPSYPPVHIPSPQLGFRWFVGDSIVGRWVFWF